MHYIGAVKTLILALLSMLMVSCGSIQRVTIADAQRLNKEEQHKAVVDDKLNKQVQIYVDGALRSIERVEAKEEIRLAIRVLKDAQDIIGVPTVGEQLNIGEGSDAEDELGNLEKDKDTELAERKVLEDKIEALQKKIEDDASQLAALQSKGFIDKIKDMIMEYIEYILIGLALLILLPLLIKYL